MGIKLKGPLSGKAPGLNAEMNVTPFVDVMLVLLIIFMVVAPLASVSVRVDLPPSTAAATPKDDPIFISVQKDGSLHLGDDAVTMESLANALNAMISARHQTADNERIYVRADQEIQYKRVMEVMNTLQDAGYTKIGLVGEDVRN